MVLEQSRHVGKLIFIPILTICCQKFGLSLSAVACAVVLCACAVFTVCIRSPGARKETSRGCSQIWQAEQDDLALLLTPLWVISRSMMKHSSEPKKKRELMTPFFITICTVNAISMGYIHSLPSLFQVSYHQKVTVGFEVGIIINMEYFAYKNKV